VAALWASDVVEIDTHFRAKPIFSWYPFLVDPIAAHHAVSADAIAVVAKIYFLAPKMFVAAKEFYN
jgi:hypothetical protein